MDLKGGLVERLLMRRGNVETYARVPQRLRIEHRQTYRHLTKRSHSFLHASGRKSQLPESIDATPP